MRMRNSLICCGTRMWETLFKAEERSILKDCHVRYQQLNSPVHCNSIALCVPEEGSHEIHFDFFVLVFKIWELKDCQNHLVCRLRGEFKSTKAKIYVVEIARHEEQTIEAK